MPRKATKDGKSRNKKLQNFAGGDGFDNSAQESEYLNLRKRVEARKDAKQILEIAKRIDEEPDE